MRVKPQDTLLDLTLECGHHLIQSLSCKHNNNNQILNADSDHLAVFKICPMSYFGFYIYKCITDIFFKKHFILYTNLKHSENYDLWAFRNTILKTYTKPMCKHYNFYHTVQTTGKAKNVSAWQYWSPVIKNDNGTHTCHKAWQHPGCVAGEWTIYLGEEELCAPRPICLRMGVGGCGVELSLIEDYLLNYSSTASVKQPWIKKASVRQTLGSSAVLN